MRWFAASMFFPLVAHAHEGHGAPGVHLHAWDALGLLALVFVAILVIQKLRR